MRLNYLISGKFKLRTQINRKVRIVSLMLLLNKKASNSNNCASIAEQRELLLIVVTS